MTTHRIMAPDVFAGREPRLILWDDETGEVSGEHSAVAHLNATLERIERDDGYLGITTATGRCAIRAGIRPSSRPCSTSAW